jgi:hypothetical protein
VTICTQSEWQDIGHGVSVQIRYIDGVTDGVAYKHAPCGDDYVPVKGRWGGAEAWDLVQLEPLTLAPSLLCRRCGHHGFIQNGKWVPA